ncbi:MAG: DUF308 domain-containing protein [Chloroflexota bacterium]
MAHLQPPSDPPWWLILIEGIALIIIGALFLINPAKTAVIATMVLGIYWLVSGVLSIVSIFIDSSAWGWKLLVGALGIIAGIIILQHPLWSPAVVGATLIIILGIQGILMGIMQLIMALQGGGWGLAIIGVISLVIGVILLFNVWIAAVSLPWVIGIFAIIGGILAVIEAFRER